MYLGDRINFTYVTLLSTRYMIFFDGLQRVKETVEMKDSHTHKYVKKEYICPLLNKQNY